MRYVVAITGASGSCYGLRLLETLPGEKEIIVSEVGQQVVEYETGVTAEEISAFGTLYRDDDLFAPPASGTHQTAAMIICPCSQSTIAKIANGIADSLITRAASVALKEQRKLILVTRETPLSIIMLENELKLAKAGAVILPASPGFYKEQKSVGQLVDFVVGKILDQLGEPHQLFARWE
ncbi:UbiX family flavin prenyltransferase [Candidatus Methanomassiliicoccus intestinalis]|uniref:UbiX family flavin prenyltransferase n=1 Tax=Candidatus Methanomassiliicoccus intestinalis TaxID=1406512 RepID=UPI0037DD2E4A